jgi:hypothetical protein
MTKSRSSADHERRGVGQMLASWSFKTFSRSALDGPCGVLFLKSSCWSNNSLVHTNEARLAWQSSELIAQQENLGLFRGFVHLGDAEEFKGAPKRR